MNYAHVLSRFQCVRPAGPPSTWHARCPAHDDRNPSLRLWVASGGRLCAKCYAGCDFAAVVAASRTDPRDWFPAPDRTIMAGGAGAMQRKVEATYDYRDSQGKLVFQVVRYGRDADGKKAFSQRRPDGNGGWLYDLRDLERPLPLYRLPELLAKPGWPVIVCEGEKDVEAVRALGLVATCNPGGAGKWALEHGHWLRGRRVAVLPDNDPPGELHAAQVAGSCLVWGAASVRVVHLGGPDGGDVSDWLADSLPGGKAPDRKASLLAQIRAAPEWAIVGRAA